MAKYHEIPCILYHEVDSQNLKTTEFFHLSKLTLEKTPASKLRKTAADNRICLTQSFDLGASFFF